MIRPFLIPHTDGRMLIFIDSTEPFPAGSIGGYPLKTGSILIVTGFEPKEYIWNSYEWISSGSGNGGTEMVYNGTGSSIAAGKLLYRNGWNATYNCFTVALSDADVSGAQAELIATEAIANGATGAASTAYELTGQNTSAASAVGDPVYLDTTAGGWTLTAPTGTDGIQQVVGRVAVDHASTGEIRFILPGVIKKTGTNEMQAVTQGSIIVGGASNTAGLLDAKGSGKILVGDGTDLKSVSVSGDISLSAAGEATLTPKIVRTVYGQATVVQINEGLDIISAAAGKTLKITGIALQAIGGAAGTATSVDIADTDGTVFAAFPVGTLTQNSVVLLGGATVTNIHSALTADKGIKIQKAGGDLETCTHVNYIIEYCFDA